jgi:hypothetical protein
MDYYVHGVQSQFVYRTPINDEETLRGRIEQSWREMRVADCRAAIDQINQRMMAIVENDGNQIDQLFRVS